MRFRSVCSRIIIPLFLPYSLFIGCSVIGTIAGGASQPAREGRVTSTPGLDSIALETDVQLVRYDRSVLEGTFKGIALYPGKMYARIYDTAVSRSAYRGFIPKLNQEIMLRAGGTSDAGFFKGIDRGEILYQPSSGSDTVGVPLDDLEWLQSSDSLRLDGRTARKLVRDGSLPGRRVILLEIGREVRNVPYESVEIVQVKARGSGALTGFLIGAAVDLTVVALLVVSANQAESDCNRSASGCDNNQSCERGHR
jgi:hypothetical protein